MLAGSVMGTAALIDGMTARIEEELGRPVTLVITGGLSRYVAPLCKHPLHRDPQLLLKGLALLYTLNAPAEEKTAPTGGTGTPNRHRDRRPPARRRR